MQDEDGKREAPGKGAKQDERKDRLKQALRENLKRRKSQARGRDLQGPSDSGAPSNVEDVPPYDGGTAKPDK